MKNIRLFAFLSIVLIVSTVFCACYKKSPENRSSNTNKRQVMSDKKIVEDPSLKNAYQYPTYLMELNGTTLTLYEVQNNIRIALSTITIDPSYYPPEDIKELNKGVVAYSKEDGFAKMENFTN